MSDMYEEVTHPNVNPLAGKCPIGCSYCYVQTKLMFYPGIKAKYSGNVRIDDKILCKKIKGGTRFLCSCIDLFAEEIPDETIIQVLEWAAKQPTEWIMQSKNPKRMMAMWDDYGKYWKQKNASPSTWILGTTIETNRHYPKIMPRSHPHDRIIGRLDFITIEPIMDFDHDEFIDIITTMMPRWVWIGADTSKSNLPEPDAAKIERLITDIEAAGIYVRRKKGLVRLTGAGMLH